MFNRIPTVLRSQEIIDKAFGKASKVEEPYQPTMELRIRKEIQDRISIIENTTVLYLKKLVKRFPSNDRLHPYYRDLLDMLFDLDAYRISLSKLDKTADKITELSTQKIRQLKYITDVREMNDRMREFYGRVASLIGDLSKDLVFLSKCRDGMRAVPQIEENTPTFIIAGMPNVGKSSLLGKITTSKPKIAPYPFTTQSIFIGFLHRDGERLQFIDTPGILDRPMADRNEMELNSILALRHIDCTIFYLFDFSETSLYDREAQESLFSEIERNMKKKMVRVQSKIDLSKEKIEEVAVSASTGEGLDSLVDLAMRISRSMSHAA